MMLDQLFHLISEIRGHIPLSERITPHAGDGHQYPLYAAHLMLDGHEYVLVLTPTLLADEDNRGEPLDDT